MNLSDQPTPLTDAAIDAANDANGAPEVCILCKQLEREVFALMSICERYRDACVDLYPREYGDDMLLDEINDSFDALKLQLVSATAIPTDQKP